MVRKSKKVYLADSSLDVCEFMGDLRANPELVDKLNGLMVYRVDFPKRTEDRRKLFTFLNDSNLTYYNSLYGDTAVGMFVVITDQLKQLKGLVDFNPERVEFNIDYLSIWLRLIFRRALMLDSSCVGLNDRRGVLRIQSCVEKANLIEGAGPKIRMVVRSFDCEVLHNKSTDLIRVPINSMRVVLEPIERHEIHPKSRDIWLRSHANYVFKAHSLSWIQDGLETFSEVKDKSVDNHFINLEDEDGLKASRTYIYADIQARFIKEALVYGIDLKPMELELTRLERLKASKALRGKDTLSMSVFKQIHVVDLRKDKSLNVIELLNECCPRVLSQYDEHGEYRKNISPKDPFDVEFVYSDIDESNLTPDVFDRKKVYLAVIDHTENAADDHYIKDVSLKSAMAIQHININPYDVLGLISRYNSKRKSKTCNLSLLSSMDDDECEEGLRGLHYRYWSDHMDEICEPKTKSSQACNELASLMGVSNPQAVLKKSPKYEKYKNNLSRRLYSSILSLHKKALVLGCIDIDSLFPGYVDVIAAGGFTPFSPDVVCLYDGVMFTTESSEDNNLYLKACYVDGDDEDLVASVNKVLARFDFNFDSLAKLVRDKYPYVHWDYNDQPFDPNKDFKRRRHFLSRLILVIHRDEKGVHVALQDKRSGIDKLVLRDPQKALDLLMGAERVRPPELYLLPDEDAFFAYTERVCDEYFVLQRDVDSLRLKYTVIKETINSTFEGKKESVPFDSIKKTLGSLKLSSTHKKVLAALYSIYLGERLVDPKNWIKESLNSDISLDENSGFIMIGSKDDFKNKIERQPSLKAFHSLQGDVNWDLLISMFDVDWVRDGAYAGNLCYGSLAGEYRAMV